MVIGGSRGVDEKKVAHETKIYCSAVRHRPLSVHSDTEYTGRYPAPLFLEDIHVPNHPDPVMNPYRIPVRLSRSHSANKEQKIKEIT
jgi:hypothetical protein